MSVSKVGGHGVTSVLGASAGQQVKPAQPSFIPTQGPAAHNGISTSNSLNITGGGQKKTFPAKEKGSKLIK